MTVAILAHELSADSGDHSREELESVLRNQGYEPRHVPIESGGSADLNSARGDVVVVGGGDGTFGALLPQLRRLGLPVILTPLGTADNVARSPRIDSARDALAPDAVFRPFDLGRCGVGAAERLFSEAAGPGALAAVLRQE